MRKPFLFSLIIPVLLVQSCSAATPKPPTPTLEPSSTPAPSPTNTVTPSPTIVRIPTQDFDSTPTAQVFPIFTGIVSPTVVPTVTPSKPGAGFESVEVSDNKIYYGICKPNRVKISAVMENPDDVFSVALFYRLKDQSALDYTPWHGLGMDDNGDGFWSRTLLTKEIKERRNYSKSWIQYQLVAVDLEQNIIARTQVYFASIALFPCE